jgi:type I restriction enzyme, R subunit
MLTLAQAADMTGALAAYKLALAEERIAELKGRLEEMRQERDRARAGEDGWKAQCEAVARQIALAHDARTAQQPSDTQPSRFRPAGRWIRATGCLAGAGLLLALSTMLTAREQQLANAPEEARAALGERLDWMRSVDMAVVVSQSQNEIDDLKQKRLDILPHRERMQKEDLDSKFKDADDPLRLVFVCAMWITGFDVPTCSTMYLDKPMKNHTLMQAIARANRRAPGKTSGVIVDYVGVFQNLQKALAIYATHETEGQSPIKNKDELVKALEEALAKARAFCKEFGVEVNAIFAAEKLARLALISQAVEALVAPDERRRGFFRVAGAATRAYRALLPDDRAAPYLKPVATLHVLAEALRGKLGPVDISAVSAKIEALLDEKIEGVAAQ